jgi:hypothetical protein
MPLPSDVAMLVPSSSLRFVGPILRSPPQGPAGPTASDHQSSPEAQAEDAGPAPLLCCVQCLHTITSDNRRMTVSGAHRHVFANPFGHVFEIGCFSDAPGCAVVGAPSPDFSWFTGTTWRVAVCAACGLHLGWRYESGDRAFYGLILDRLRRPGADERY